MKFKNVNGTLVLSKKDRHLVYPSNTQVIIRLTVEELETLVKHAKKQKKKFKSGYFNHLSTNLSFFYLDKKSLNK